MAFNTKIEWWLCLQENQACPGNLCHSNFRIGWVTGASYSAEGAGIYMQRLEQNLSYLIKSQIVYYSLIWNLASNGLRYFDISFADDLTVADDCLICQ